MARLTVALVAGATVLLVAAPTGTAFQMQHNPNANLDGKIVLSPAAERITTTEPEGSQPIGPGIKVIRYILLQNRSKAVLEFDLEVSEVVGSNAEDIVEVRHGSHSGAAAWVQIERQQLKLKPGATATVQLTIAIPRAVKPGSKSFAVTATQRSAPVASKGAGVTPVFRQVAIFIVDLPGPAPIKGRITQAAMTSSSDTLRSAGTRRERKRKFFLGKHRLTFTMAYENKGERLLVPEGSIEVRDMFNRVIKRYPVKRFTVYPAGEAAATIDMRQMPSFGAFRARLTLNSDAGKQERKLGWVILVPKWLLFALGAVAGYGLYLLVRLINERRRYGKWEDYVGDGGEGGGDEDDDDDDDPDDSALLDELDPDDSFSTRA